MYMDQQSPASPSEDQGSPKRPKPLLFHPRIEKLPLRHRLIHLVDRDAARVYSARRARHYDD